MLRAIALFELRRQLRGHVFWVVFAISLTMVLGSVGVDALRVGVHSGGLRNGAEAIVLTAALWTLFFLFATAAFVADAVLRDVQVGFADIFAAAPVRRADHLYGRFAGAFAAVLLCFASVPLGIALGGAMPWVAPASVGPVRLGALGFAYGVVAVPNLLLSASLGFALATVSRSMSVALVGAVALLTAYGLGARAGAALPPVLEPFGFAAYARAVAGWAPAARDLMAPPLTGLLLANRLLVLAASAVLLALASVRMGGPAGRRSPVADGPPRDRPAALRATPSFDRWTLARQFGARLRLEVGQTVRTPVFAALLLLGLANALATLWPMQRESPAAVVRALGGAFQLTPIVIALFFTGELRWTERERGIGALLGATPLRAAAYLLPKYLAVALVLAGALAVAAGSAATLLIATGRASDAALSGAWLLSSGYDALTFAALAIFLQAVAPNKLAGWGFTILYLIATLALDRMGATDPAYRYGRYPGYPWPGALSGAAHVGLYRLYWAVIAALLLAAAARLARRPQSA